jgi:hypothetical protein
MPQDAVSRALPQIQAQASQPLVQRAIDPSPRSERGNQPRTNGEKSKGGGNATGSAGGKRGGSVNIRV